MTHWWRAGAVRPLVLIAFMIVCLVTGVVRAEVDEAVLAAEAARVAAVAKATPAVLAIFAGAAGGGSGVVISPDGYALSNFHVTKPAGNAMKCGMPDGQIYDAVIVGVDPTGDVALIKLLGRDDFPHAELADSDAVQVGDWCYAIGNPFLLATDFKPTVSYGVVSGVRRYQYPAGTLLEYADCIQVDAAINPGNSGGPLFNDQGQLIGINGRGSFEKRGRVNVGVGYAISINQIKNFLGSLKSGRIVDHATLGAVVGTDAEGHVVITDILEHADVYRRGLRYDDEIVSFADRPITTVNALKNALGIFPAGWRVPLTFRRDGKRYQVLARLRSVHSRAELLEKIDGRLPSPDEPKEKPDGAPNPDKPRVPERRPDSTDPHVAQPMPEAVQKVFEAKTGFANYHFNGVHRDRVGEGFRSHGDFSTAKGDWVLAGKAQDGGEIRITLGDEQSALELPIGDFVLSADEPLGAVPNPPGSGGLLAAMHLWRKLLVTGPGKMPQVEYLGTAPLPGHEGLVDVLVAHDSDVECRFMFDPVEGQLLAIEMYSAEDEDPCEVYFGEFRPAGNRTLPHRLEVRYGNGLFGIFTLTEVALKNDHGDTEDTEKKGQQ